MDVKLAIASKREDPALLPMCREILSDFPQTNWEVVLVSANEPTNDADIRLWDLDTDAGWPEDPAWGTRDFVLVPRREVASFRAKHPEAAASVILKPVTRSVLKGVVAQIVSCKQPYAGGHGNLRSDRDELFQCLIEANLRLQEYDQERTNFLTRAVHDFRAPLTALSGYCGLLLEEQLGGLNERQKEVLRRMQNSARRLGRMANAMFQLSVGKHRDEGPSLRPGRIQDCVEQALYEVAQFTEEKRLNVEVDFAAHSGVLCFDASQIEQVLVNLLDNACKFTPRFGTVQVCGAPTFWERRAGNVVTAYARNRREHQHSGPNAYRIDVKDSGPGIASEHLPHLFEEYTVYPVNQDRSGGGLGLAICKMIVDQHGGRIWAHNNGEGATLSFVLPYRQMESRVDPISHEEDHQSYVRGA